MDASFYDPIKYNYAEYTVCKKCYGSRDLHFFVDLMIFGYEWYCALPVRELSNDTYCVNVKTYY